MAARARAVHYRDVVLPLKQRIVALVQEYNFMLSGPFELLASRQAEIAAQRDHIDALGDYWMARVELEAAVGAPLETVKGGIEMWTRRRLITSALAAAVTALLPRGAARAAKTVPGNRVPVETPDGATAPWTMKGSVKEFRLVAEPVERASSRPVSNSSAGATMAKRPDRRLRRSRATGCGSW